MELIEERRNEGGGELIESLIFANECIKPRNNICMVFIKFRF